MTERQIFTLAHDVARKRAADAVRSAPDGYRVTIEPHKRTLDQNAYQWPYLLGFSLNKQWPVNGRMCTLSPEEWKDVLTAAFEGETMPRLAQAWEGDGMVMLGRRTSKYGKKRFAEWMEWLMAAAAHCGIEPVFKSAPHDHEQAA